MEALVEKLEKICMEYNNQLSKYEALIFHTQQTNEKLDKYTETNREKVDRLYLRVENRLEKLDERMDAVKEEYMALFARYSEEVGALNETQRDAFLKLLLDGLEQYKVDFSREVMRDYRTMLQAFVAQIQEESQAIGKGRADLEKLVRDNDVMNVGLSNRVQDLCIIVDSATERMNQTLAGMNDRYMEIFGEFSARVNTLNEEDRGRFIEELQATLEKYKENYGTYDALLKEGYQLHTAMAEEVQTNVESISRLETLVNKKLQQTEVVLDYIAQAYEKGFQHFAKDVSALNAQERDNLCITIRTLLEEYRFSFGKEIEGKSKEMNVLFQNTLLGICNNVGSHYKEYERMLEATKASNVELGRKLDEKTEKIESLTSELIHREEGIEKALDFLQEGYKETVQQYIRNMQSANERAQILMQETMQKNINGMLERFIHQLDLFKSERAVYLEQMENLVQQERIGREQILESHELQMTQLGKKQIQLESKMEQNQKMILRSVTGMGITIIILLSICILLLIPWGSSPVWSVVMLVVFIILGILGTVFRKKIIRWLKYIFTLSLVCGVFLTGCSPQVEVDKEVELQTQTTRDVKYELTQVHRGDVQQVMYLKCTYKQTQETEISFAIDQELITEVLVAKGDSVTKGELLASVDVEDTVKKLEELEHQLAMNELYLKQTKEKMDFQIKEAELWYSSYTSKTKDDEENMKAEIESIHKSFDKQIQSYEDTIYFQKKRLQEYKDYIKNGQLFAPMDGIISFVRSDLEGSLSVKDSCIMRMYDPATKFYTSENVEAIPYLEEGKEYAIACGLGKGLREYTVMPDNMEQWGEQIYFKLLDEDYDPNNVVSGKITLVIDQKENALYLDDNAVHSSGEDYYVYTLDDQGVRRMQFIEVGMWGDGIVEIAGGLKEGDRVILK